MNQVCVSSTFGEPCAYFYARLRFDPGAGRTGAFHLAADQWAMAWLNGRFLGRTFVQAHADECRYQSFPLDPHLQAGENVLALLLHAWRPPAIEIAGVPPVMPVTFACAGHAGASALDDLAAWRVAPAAEYRPAARHNDLIGHEEARDLRLEPQGWKEAGFDDSGWKVPLVRPLNDRRFLPSPLRSLKEEAVYPARIVQQGAPAEGMALESPAPASYGWWRMEIRADGHEQLFFHMAKPGSRFFVDGEEWFYPVEPPCEWVGLYQPVRLCLSAGPHVLSGFRPVPAAAGEAEKPFPFGWRPLPEGGDRLEWSRTEAGPYVPAAKPCRPDVEHRLLVDGIAPASRAALDADGHLDIEARDEDYTVILELPRNMTVLPRLEIADASAGSRIEILYSERLSGVEGLILPAAYVDRVTLRGGPQVYEVAFQYKSARILVLRLRAKGGFIRLRRAWATFRHYDYRGEATFKSSDLRLNRIWEICRNTMEAGSQDYIMDGPWREQMLYIGDNQVHNRAGYLLFGDHELVEWQHTLYAQGQMPDGLFQPNQPCRTPPEAYRLLDQVILWPQQIEHHALYTGRTDFVRALQPNMIRLLDGFQTGFGQAKAGDVRLRNLTGWNWVDHPGLEDGRVRSIRHDGIPTAINLLYLLSLQAAVRLLTAYDCPDDAARFAGVADTLGERLRDEHWHRGWRMFSDCVVNGAPSPERSVHVNLLAIEAGLADEPGRLLDRTWKRPGVLQIQGVFFRQRLFEVLHRLGRTQEILNEIRDFWGGMVDSGLTTTAEYMPISGDWGSSVGHPWGASPVIYLVRNVAGLDPLEPGWRRVAFRPRLADLKEVHLTVPTPLGDVVADLHQDGNGIGGTLSCPAGMDIISTDAGAVRVV